MALTTEQFWIKATKIDIKDHSQNPFFNDEILFNKI
jgi:hypothetical protein